MKRTLLLTLLFSFTFQLQAGTTFCESSQSGPWSDPNTWNNCGGGVPNATWHEALILTSHVVTLDFNAVILQKFTMEVGSVLNVDNGTDPVTIETTTNPFDAQEGQIQLFNSDLT